jgi:hypothetical protein
VQAPEAGIWQRHGDGRGCLRTTHWACGCRAWKTPGRRPGRGKRPGPGPQLWLPQRAAVPGPASSRRSSPRRPRCLAGPVPVASRAAGLRLRCRAAADPQALLARRDASFARSQKHYYAQPPHIERGWRNYLIDMQGRSYLDMLNNVAVLGHGHPRMVAESARQWSLLNTNSRFHYAAITEFSERLLDLAPKASTGCSWSTAAPRPTTWRSAWPGPTAAGATCSACWRPTTAGRWPPMPSPPPSPTTRRPWKPARTGCTRSRRRTPSVAVSAVPTAPPTTCGRRRQAG